MTTAMKHHWTDEEREYVRCNYRGTKASAMEIGHQLDATWCAVRCVVAQLGIAKRTHRHRWDPRQDEILRDLIPQYAPATVAQIMKCSVNAIVVRSKRLGLHRRYRNGWYTAKEVCEILGVDHRRVQSWIDSDALKASYHNGQRPGLGSRMWHIDEKDLRHFIRRYPEELNGRNLDVIQVVDILVGLATTD